MSQEKEKLIYILHDILEGDAFYRAHLGFTVKIGMKTKKIIYCSSLKNFIIVLLNLQKRDIVLKYTLNFLNYYVCKIMFINLFQYCKTKSSTSKVVVILMLSTT